MELLATTLTTLVIFLLGASIGSFLNVVVYRLPARMSLLHPGSHCPQCKTPIKPSDNVPVLGWLRLQGRCRACCTAIAPRYPLVEATTGILFVLVAWRFSLPLPAVGYWVFTSWLLALALIDWDTRTLPNPLTQSGLVLGLLFQVAIALQTPEGGDLPHQFMLGVGGAVVGIWVMDLIRVGGTLLFQKDAMGGGDPKLAAMMGAWLGWKLVLLSGFLASAIGAFVGGGAIALGLLQRDQPIPFGPLLALGALLSMFFGEAIIAAYVQLFFPSFS